MVEVLVQLVEILVQLEKVLRVQLDKSPPRMQEMLCLGHSCYLRHTPDQDSSVRHCLWVEGGVQWGPGGGGTNSGTQAPPAHPNSHEKRVDK